MKGDKKMQAVEIDCAWVTEFVTQVCRNFGLPLPEKIEIKPVRRGRYRYKTNKITLPKFIFREGIWYVKAYIIHELCHSVVWGHGDSELVRLILVWALWSAIMLIAWALY
jgi:hypothetical protein